MEHYVLICNIYDASHEAMEELLRSLFGDLQSTATLYGHDILFESKTMRLFCSTSDGAGSEWSMNADFKTSLPALQDFLSILTEVLIEADYNYAIGYYLSDDQGNEVGEEVSLFHPDFEARYAQRLASRQS